MSSDTRPVPELVVSRSRPGAYRTIADALGAAGREVRLRVEPGAYVGQLTARDRTVVVTAADGPGTVTLETHDDTPVVRAEGAHVVLADVTVASRGGSTPKTVDVVGGVLELTGCDVTWLAGNGVVVKERARAVVTGCRFRGSGHGIGFIESGGLVERCDFTGADLCAVGLKLGSAPTVRHCTFRDVRHGVMAFQGSAGTIEDCEFTGVGATAIGASARSAPTVRRCRVTGGPGTGIFVGTESGGSVEDCVVTDLGGHGIALATSGAPEVRRCRVERTGKHGLYVEGGGSARVEGLVVGDARSTAILVQNAQPVLTDVAVTGGEVGVGVTGEPGTRVRLVGGSVRDTTGHGLVVFGSAHVSAERTTLSSRSSPAAATRTASLTLTGCVLSDGTTGASAAHGSHLVLAGCTITDIDGPAIVVDDTATLHATATTARRCTGDGLVCGSTGEASLEDCDLTGVAGEPVTGDHADAVRVVPAPPTGDGPPR
jgi:hypothetical protein